jgi:hypothetical protein
VPFFENKIFVEGGDQSDWKYELSLHLGFECPHKNFPQDISSFRGASFCEQAEGLKKCSKVNLILVYATFTPISLKIKFL